MTDTLISVNAPLDSLSCPHYALLYIDDNGKLRFGASSSVANECHSILSFDVIHSFLKAVALSGTGTKPNSSHPYLEDQNGSPLSPDSPETSNHSRSSSTLQLSGQPQKRKKSSHETMVSMGIRCYPKTTLPVRNHSLLRKYYEKAFESLQQVNCRILAKAYIKLVEPRKQVNYPYNGRKIISGSPQKLDPEETKPSWWPAGVIHREPDHLKKPGRIQLLLRILCDLRESHGICVDKLKEADQSIRRQISPAGRLVLDEIYRVRGEEERYLNDESNSKVVVTVSRVDIPNLDHQLSLYLPGDFNNQHDATYREEPNMDSHTSVFPSSSPASDITLPRTDAPTAYSLTPFSAPETVAPAIPTTWNTCPPEAPASLPPLHTAIKPFPHDTASSYALDFSTSYEPAQPLEIPPFAMDYYANSQSNLAPHNPHQHGQGQGQGHVYPSPSISAMRPASCSTPYYFDY